MTHALGLGFTVFTVIFLLELPDKTALAALLLATRHRPLPVFLGAAAAFVIQSAVAVVAGSLLSLLPREPIRIGAGILFLGMAALSSVIKRDLSTMGKFLFIGAIMLLVGMVLNIFLQSPALFVTIAVLMVGIFSAFILYDLKRVRDGEETNYISATLNVYLDLYNVFQALLSLLGFAGSRE